MRNAILSMGQFETRVNDVFSMAIICGQSSEELQNRLNRHVYDEVNRTTGKSKRRVYSGYMSGFVQGLITSARDDLYKNHLEFCYLVDGVLYSTHKTSEKKTTEQFYKNDTYKVLNSAPNGHYWRKSNKPFYIGE